MAVPVRIVLAGLVATIALVACGAGASPSASPMPTPTPIATPAANPVSSPEDAAARVIATDRRFAGATMIDAGAIGLTKWWAWRALDDGGYEITMTVGWGDCPAGCINHHTWVFDVAVEGTVTKVSESGDEVPPGA